MTDDAQQFRVIGYDQTGLRGRIARVSGYNAFFDFPPYPELTHVVILDDEPSPTLDIRVADIADPAKYYVTDINNIQLVE